MNVESVFSINDARGFLHEAAVDPSVQALHAARDGPGFLLYEKKATYSPKGPRVTSTSCDHTGNCTASRVYRPVPVSLEARTVWLFVVHVCIPQ